MGHLMISPNKISIIEGAASFVITWRTDSITVLTNSNNEWSIYIVNQCSIYICTSDEIDSHASLVILYV
jgi:hypothetical protein